MTKQQKKDLLDFYNTVNMKTSESEKRLWVAHTFAKHHDLNFKECFLVLKNHLEAIDEEEELIIDSFLGLQFLRQIMEKKCEISVSKQKYVLRRLVIRSSRRKQNFKEINFQKRLIDTLEYLSI